MRASCLHVGVRRRTVQTLFRDSTGIVCRVLERSGRVCGNHTHTMHQARTAPSETGLQCDGASTHE